MAEAHYSRQMAHEFLFAEGRENIMTVSSLAPTSKKANKHTKVPEKIVQFTQLWVLTSSTPGRARFACRLLHRNGTTAFVGTHE